LHVTINHTTMVANSYTEFIRYFSYFNPCLLFYITTLISHCRTYTFRLQLKIFITYLHKYLIQTMIMTPQNNLLHINLTTDPIPQPILYKFMGGKGLAAHYLYNENPPGCDPLSPDNLLAIMNGPLTRAPATNCVISVCAKSPLTGTWNDSHCNGYRDRNCGIKATWV